MKNSKILFIALTLVTAIGITSCSKITDMLTVTLKDVAFNVDVDVTELALKTSGFEFGGTAVLDPSENEELAQYLSTIREVNIKSIVVTVNSATPATGLELLDATFSIKDNVNQSEFSYTIPAALPIEVGSSITLDSSTPGFKNVSTIISSLHSSTVSCGGHLNQSGFVLGFSYAITADITVGVPSE